MIDTTGMKVTDIRVPKNWVQTFSAAFNEFRYILRSLSNDDYHILNHSMFDNNDIDTADLPRIFVSRRSDKEKHYLVVYYDEEIEHHVLQAKLIIG